MTDRSVQAPVAFAALRHRSFRAYFLTSAAAMMADNIEHVISYWVMFEKFQSPALAGFAVVSHWLPFLLFSVYSGALADRYAGTPETGAATAAPEAPAEPRRRGWRR